MRWFEPLFPMSGILFAAWAIVPDLPTMCAWDWHRMCGLDAIVRFDVLLPLFFPLTAWALYRSFRRAKDA